MNSELLKLFAFLDLVSLFFLAKVSDCLFLNCIMHHIDLHFPLHVAVTCFLVIERFLSLDGIIKQVK